MMQSSSTPKDHTSFDSEWLKKLEELRRSAGLKIDARGRWWQKVGLSEEPFEHPRVIAALSHGLDWKLDHQSQSMMHRENLKGSCFQNWYGEATTCIGNQWCYVDCDLTPFLILKIKESEEEGKLMAMLNNQEYWPLSDLGIHQDILFARLAPHRLARFSADAQAQCASWLREDEHGTFELAWSTLCLPIEDSFSTSSE